MFAPILLQITAMKFLSKYKNNHLKALENNQKEEETRGGVDTWEERSDWVSFPF